MGGIIWFSVGLHVSCDLSQLLNVCSPASRSALLGNFPWVFSKCFKCSAGLFFFSTLFLRRKNLISFSYVLLRCRGWRWGGRDACSWDSKINDVKFQVSFLSLQRRGGSDYLCPHPLSLPLSWPKGTWGILRTVPLSLTHHSSSKKPPNLSPLETLLHPNEAILWGFVMVMCPLNPLREALSSPVKWAPPHSFIFLRWNTLLSLFVFHIPRILSMVRCCLLS